MDDPKNIGRYAVVRLLGRGGMGRVYLARDPLIDRLVAVKILSATLDAAARERFGREARSAGRLHHPRIVTIFDVGEDAGRPFIAMEYVRGETLAALIRGRPALPVADALRLIQDACEGLAFAHADGLVHLDIKPENLIRGADGRCKILDFGIARVVGTDETQTQSVLGTLGYMSPEQLAGRPPDPRSDVYAIGCVIHEAVARRPAFDGPVGEMVLRIGRGDYAALDDVVPGVHPGLVRLSTRAMALDPADRYQDVNALRVDLDAVCEELGAGAPAVPSPVTRRMNTRTRRLPGTGASRARVAGSLFAVVAVTGGVAAAVWWAPREPAEPPAVVEPPPASGAASADTSPPASNTPDPVAPAGSDPTSDTTSPERTAVNPGSRFGGGPTSREPARDSGQPTGSRSAARTRTTPPARTDPAGPPDPAVPAQSNTEVSTPTAPPPVAPSAGRGRQSALDPPAAQVGSSGGAGPPASPATGATSTSGAGPASALSDEDAVRAVLRTYAMAFAALDVDAIRKVFRGLSPGDAEDYRRLFANARAYRLDLAERAIQVTGSTATVASDVTHHLDSRIANVPPWTVRATFHLRREDGAWIIERIDRDRPVESPDAIDQKP